MGYLRSVERRAFCGELWPLVEKRDGVWVNEADHLAVRKTGMAFATERRRRYIELGWRMLCEMAGIEAHIIPIKIST